MCCEDLVCARCAGPVVEANCPACRASKAAMHSSGFTVTPQMLAMLCAVLTVLLLVAGHRLG